MGIQQQNSVYLLTLLKLFPVSVLPKKLPFFAFSDTISSGSLVIAWLLGSLLPLPGSSRGACSCMKPSFHLSIAPAVLPRAVAPGWFFFSPFAEAGELNFHLCLSKNYRLFFFFAYISINKLPSSCQHRSTDAYFSFCKLNLSTGEDSWFPCGSTSMEISRTEDNLYFAPALRTLKDLCPAFIYCLE